MGFLFIFFFFSIFPRFFFTCVSFLSFFFFCLRFFQFLKRFFAIEQVKGDARDIQSRHRATNQSFRKVNLATLKVATNYSLMCGTETWGQHFNVRNDDMPSKGQQPKQTPQAMERIKAKTEHSEIVLKRSSKSQCSRGVSCSFEHDADMNGKGRRRISRTTSNASRRKEMSKRKNRKVPVRQESRTNRNTTFLKEVMPEGIRMLTSKILKKISSPKKIKK